VSFGDVFSNLPPVDEVGDVVGPVRDISVEPEYLDIEMGPHSSFERPATPGHTVLSYLVDGRAAFDEEGRDGIADLRRN